MTGQFLQVDPAISVTREPCAYVAGDPLASVDPLGLCKGMDGTPQDRVCSGWDFFMESLPGVVSNSVKPTFAGLAAGSTFGIGLLTNNDQACYGNDLWFKISYGLGVASSAVGILAVGGELLASGAAKTVESAAETAIHGNSAASPATAYLYRVSNIEGDYLKTGISQSPLTRYPKSFMGDKNMEILQTGTRRETLSLERFIVERDPGPLNREPWAGTFRWDVP